jgi:nucleoside-diphosphate-sugar epimerase
VYGPSDTTLLPRLVASVRHGRLVLPAGGAVLHTLTHIDNLVLAARLALEPHAPAGVFNIGDAEAVLLRDLLKHLLERRGLDIRVTGIPYALAFQLAGASEVAARLTGRTPRLTRYAVSQLGLERTLDLSAARDRLGYRPEPTCLDGAENW